MTTTRTQLPPLKQPPAPGTSINGWGADRNPADRPAVPKEKPSTVQNVRGIVPVQQQSDFKVHLSVEHPDVTPVFGTTCPPRGLSGKLRDFAYQFGEGRLSHWMTLMLADRVDVLEGRLDDLRQGRAPHPLKERGLVTTSKQQQQVMLAAAAGVGVIVLAAVMVNRARR
jgi:hypothetical protein